MRRALAMAFSFCLERGRRFRVLGGSGDRSRGLEFKVSSLRLLGWGLGGRACGGQGGSCQKRQGCMRPWTFNSYRYTVPSGKHHDIYFLAGFSGGQLGRRRVRWRYTVPCWEHRAISCKLRTSMATCRRGCHTALPTQTTKASTNQLPWRYSGVIQESYSIL